MQMHFLNAKQAFKTEICLFQPKILQQKGKSQNVLASTKKFNKTNQKITTFILWLAKITTSIFDQIHFVNHFVEFVDHVVGFVEHFVRFCGTSLGIRGTIRGRFCLEQHIVTRNLRHLSLIFRISNVYLTCSEIFRHLCGFVCGPQRIPRNSLRISCLELHGKRQENVLTSCGACKDKTCFPIFMLER